MNITQAFSILLGISLSFSMAACLPIGMPTPAPAPAVATEAFPERQAGPSSTPEAEGGMPLTPTPPVPSPTITIQPTLRPTLEPASIVLSLDYGGQEQRFERAFVAPYGKALVVFLDDGQMQVILLEKGEAATFRLPFALPSENAISVQLEQVLIAEYDAEENVEITLWQATPGEEAKALVTISETDAFITSLAFSPDGKTLAVGVNLGQIRLYRTQDGARLRVIQAFHDFVTSLAFSPDGRYLIVDSFSFDANTYVFETGNGAKVATVSTESWEPGRVSFSPDGRLAAVTASDGTHIVATANWQATGATIPGVWEGAFTCDSQGFMLGTGNQTYIYSLANGLQTGTLDEGPIYCLSNGRTAAIHLDYDNNMLTLLDITDLVRKYVES